MSLYVQYGCGWIAPATWENFDASPTLRFERIPLIGKLYTKNLKKFPDSVKYGDIVRGLPINASSCVGVYCSHILEHLSLDELRLALKNTYKILKPGGIFRLVMPDLEFYINQYILQENNLAAMQFMQDTGLGIQSRRVSFLDFLKAYFGNSEHLWMWDFKSIKMELENTGFADIRRAARSDSKDPAFLDVESKERWHNALGIECQRPK